MALGLRCSVSVTSGHLPVLSVWNSLSRGFGPRWEAGPGVGGLPGHTLVPSLTPQFLCSFLSPSPAGRLWVAVRPEPLVFPKSSSLACSADRSASYL